MLDLIYKSSVFIVNILYNCYFIQFNFILFIQIFFYCLNFKYNHLMIFPKALIYLENSSQIFHNH